MISISKKKDEKYGIENKTETLKITENDYGLGEFKGPIKMLKPTAQRWFVVVFTEIRVDLSIYLSEYPYGPANEHT